MGGNAVTDNEVPGPTLMSQTRSRKKPILKNPVLKQVRQSESWEDGGPDQENSTGQIPTSIYHVSITTGMH